jgi:hypothetical protein
MTSLKFAAGCVDQRVFAETERAIEIKIRIEEPIATPECSAKAV